MPSPQLRIAIVGAGPAGLTLGVLLHKHGIPFTIFELRQEPMEEELQRPAGSLDLHEGSGLAAIRECGLFEEFAALTGDCTEADRVRNMHGDLLYADEGELINRPEIARPKIIKLLLSNLPASSVRWGHKLTSVKASASPERAETELDFGEHGKKTFDLVIGADGAWSRVRAFLTAEKPHYAGMHIITLDIRQIASKVPASGRVDRPRLVAMSWKSTWNLFSTFDTRIDKSVYFFLGSGREFCGHKWFG